MAGPTCAACLTKGARRSHEGALQITDRKAGCALFEFHDPGRLVDGDLELVLVERHPEDPLQGWVPSYRFYMVHPGGGAPLGRIDLRVGDTPQVVLYAGNIGYEVAPQHRGHRYAARACGLLLSLARSHGLDDVWITCNPDNWPSRRTCELAGAKFVEIVDLPPDNEMYRRGERKKCRYRIDLRPAQ